jgi:hypothetical protein
MAYASLADVRSELKATSTTDDNIALLNLTMASKRIDSEMKSRRPYFAPYLETRTFVLNANNINTYWNLLYMRMPVLSLSSVTLNGTSITALVELYPPYADPYNMYGLRLTDPSLTWWSYCTTVRTPYTVAVTGVWGWNSNYAQAWQSVDTITTIGGINASATSFTVSDVDGANLDGFTPRLSAGNLIQLENEWLDVLATNVTTNTVTVRRGVNGSTASAHALGTAVQVYQVEDDIRRVTARQAGMMYARRGAYDATNITDIGTQVYPSDLLAELRGVLNNYDYA